MNTSAIELRLYAEMMPEGDAHDDREEQGVHRQFDGRGQPLDQQVGHGQAELRGDTELAGGDGLQVDDELVVDERGRGLVEPELDLAVHAEDARDDGLVEAVLHGVALAGLGVGALTERRRAWVSGDDPGEREHEEDDPDQDRDAQDQAPDDKSGHRFSEPCPLERAKNEGTPRRGAPSSSILR